MPRTFIRMGLLEIVYEISETFDHLGQSDPGPRNAGTALTPQQIQ